MADDQLQFETDAILFKDNSSNRYSKIESHDSNVITLSGEDDSKVCKISGLATPTEASDAANKSYVDSTSPLDSTVIRTFGNQSKRADFHVHTRRVQRAPQIVVMYKLSISKCQPSKLFAIWCRISKSNGSFAIFEQSRSCSISSRYADFSAC